LQKLYTIGDFIYPLEICQKMIDTEAFISRLKESPESSKLSEFLTTFPLDAPISLKRRLIHNFVQSVKDTFPDSDRELVLEGWEKIVTCNLYSCLFCPGDESAANSVLRDKINEFSWIQERHLDLPFPDNTFTAQSFKLSDYSSPRDKLVVLLNITNITNEIIRQIVGTKGNDYLLPGLILTIIRSDTGDLISHLKYVMRYRNPNKISDGLVQFTLTNMMGAVSFIYNLSLKSLTLTQQDSNYQNSKFQETIDKSKDFIGNLFSNISGKMENYFSQKEENSGQDYELELAMAMSASLHEKEKNVK
jgi:hypothetical protein